MSSISIQIMYSYPDHRKQLHKTSAAIPSNAQLNLLLYGFSVWFPVLMPAACKQTLGAHDWALPHQHLKLGAVFLETHQLTVASTDQLTVASTGKSLLPSRWTQTLVLVPRDCKTTKTPHCWSFEAFSISATIRASFKRSGLSSSVAGSHQMRTSPTNSLISDALEGKPTVIQGLSIWPPFVKQSGADSESRSQVKATSPCHRHPPICIERFEIFPIWNIWNHFHSPVEPSTASHQSVADQGLCKVLLYTVDPCSKKKRVLFESTRWKSILPKFPTPNFLKL